MSSLGRRLAPLRALVARALSPLTRVEQVVLAIGVPMYIAVHREYAVTYFGEDDAANLATDAIFWRFSGSPATGHEVSMAASICGCAYDTGTHCQYG